MKAKAMLFSLFFICFSASAQELIKSSSPYKVKAWKNADQMPEETVFFTTTGQLIQVGMASNTDIVYAIIREDKMGKPSKKGSLVAYSLKTRQEIWKVGFEQKMAMLSLYGSMPILGCEDHSEAFSPEDGSTVWRHPVLLRKIIPDMGLAIGTDHAPGIGKVMGFDVATGRKQWSYESPHIMNFDHFSISGDTVITFVLPDFHQIDLRTGKGFYVDLKNHQNGSVAGAAVFGVLFGLVGAMVYYGISTSANKLTIGSDLERNFVHKGITYDASTTDVTAIKGSGRILWSFGQSRGFVGIPKIFVHKDSIYAVFPGYLSTADGTTQGHAVLIKMDPLNGKELKLVWLSDVKSQFVTDFAVNGDTMLIMMNNKMVSMNLENFETIASKQFGDVNFGSGLDRIVSPPYYTHSGNQIIKESELELEKLYIQNTSGMKIEISEDFEPVAVVPKTRFFQLARNIGAQTAYTNEVRTVIADANNTLMPFAFGPNFEMNDSYIWDWNAKELLVIPVAGIGGGQ